MRKTTIQDASLVAVVALVSTAFIWLILPFYGAVLWAVILAVLFYPLHRALGHRLGERPNLAACLSVLVCICIAVLPASMILAALTQEAAGLYNRISTRQFDIGTVLEQLRSAVPDFVPKMLSWLDLGDMAEIQSRLSSFLMQVSQMVASSAVTIGQGTAQLFVSLGVMLYLLFFLFRDGERLVAVIRNVSPLSERHTDKLVDKFASVMKATVKGNVIIAIIQGTIGGTTFWILGIDAALLWGVLMAVLSLLPALGAALIWLPVALYLLASGAYLKGVLLLAVGMLVISTIDNLLRPPLVGKGIQLPDYVVLISTLGGLSVIGMNGFVLGPLIAALFVAVWSIFAREEPGSDI
ncbi:AI-2E family transporter [Ancylobacter sp. VNQ12]|uniref:AI-2E family transporter n=1 Tax=Ancylobacter sp. VNQ12 TaxID=3400920 RepID=UPI003C122EA4